MGNRAGDKTQGTENPWSSRDHSDKNAGDQESKEYAHVVAGKGVGEHHIGLGIG